MLDKIGKIKTPNYKIWDNMFDLSYIHHFHETLSNSPIWTISNSSSPYSYPNRRRFSNHIFWGMNIFSRIDENRVEDTAPSIVWDLWDFVKGNLLGNRYYLNAISTNAQSLGQDGSTHVDNGEGGGEYTLMYFVNGIWEDDWGGNFEFLKEKKLDSSVIETIKYVPGRLILFKGGLPHRGRSPLKPYIIRQTLVFRLDLKNNIKVDKYGF